MQILVFLPKPENTIFLRKKLLQPSIFKLPQYNYKFPLNLYKILSSQDLHMLIPTYINHNRYCTYFSQNLQSFLSAKLYNFLFINKVFVEMFTEQIIVWVSIFFFYLNFELNKNIIQVRRKILSFFIIFFSSLLSIAFLIYLFWKIIVFLPFFL